MIRKPPAGWGRTDESAAVRAVRTASAVAEDGARLARRGGHTVGGVICYAFAAIWGFAAIGSGLAGSLPSLIGIGAMAALMFWLGRRSFAKARGLSA
jgi:hypothetical protein